MFSWSFLTIFRSSPLEKVSHSLLRGLLLPALSLCAWVFCCRYCYCGCCLLYFIWISFLQQAFSTNAWGSWDSSHISVRNCLHGDDVWPRGDQGRNQQREESGCKKASGSGVPARSRILLFQPRAWGPWVWAPDPAGVRPHLPLDVGVRQRAWFSAEGRDGLCGSSQSGDMLPTHVPFCSPALHCPASWAVCPPQAPSPSRPSSKVLWRLVSTLRLRSCFSVLVFLMSYSITVTLAGFYEGRSETHGHESTDYFCEESKTISSHWKAISLPITQFLCYFWNECPHIDDQYENPSCLSWNMNLKIMCHYHIIISGLPLSLCSNI